MKNIEQKITYSLCAESVDEISERIEHLCEENKLDRKNSLRIRLSIEESLDVFRKNLGEGAEVVLEFGYKFFTPYFQISVAGSACNPYNTDTDKFGNGGKSILVGIGLIPVYSYQNGKNILTFTVKKKEMNKLLSLLIVIISAFAVGILGKMLVPEAALLTLLNEIITPVEDTFFNVLKAIAGPMIFLSVAWGIYGIGDVYTLGRIGKKMMLSFFGIVLLYSFLGSFLYPFFSTTLTEGPVQFNQFGSVLTMLLDIFPDNIFSPFIDGNTLQIIFLAVVIGLSMIFLGQRTASVAKAVEQINHIINFLMSFISKLVPYFVFIVLVQIVWSNNYAVIFTVWKFVAAFAGAYVIVNLLHLFYVSLRNKTNPLILLRDCLPSYMIALTTASSAASFESNISICRKKLKIDDSMASFGIPFGMVMFKPNTAIYYLLFCFYLATSYQVNISFSWIVIAILITAVCAVATPPIPGGAAATYTMLFLQLGIPLDGLSVALAVDIIFDFFLTSGDMLCLLFEMFNLSSRLGMRKADVPQKS